MIILIYFVLLEKGNRFIITEHTSNLTHLAFQYSFIRDVGKSKILLLAIRASYANSQGKIHYKGSKLYDQASITWIFCSVNNKSYCHARGLAKGCLGHQLEDFTPLNNTVQFPSDFYEQL
jgi:hypothetical protein